MVYSIGVQNQNINMAAGRVSFGKKGEEEDKRSKCENHDRLMVKENAKHPVSTAAKIQADKLAKAFTKYPQKGLKGSKNANFYEFLTMGTVPYLVGSAMMMGVFNFASRFFDTPAAVNASKLGNKMALGVVAYGVLKNVSKKFIEVPVKLMRNVDVNIPYDKVVFELPEEGNEDNLVSHEYHKAFESVDFPRWDMFYDNKYFGEDRNAFFDKTAKKFGFKDDELDHSDQKVKPKIKETIVKTKLFTTLSSYLWAATGVGIALQKPWESLVFSPKQRFADFKNYQKIANAAKSQGKNVAKYKYFYQDFGKKLAESCKEFVNNSHKSTKYAGRALLGAAVGMTLIGNFCALHDFNKDKGSKAQASTSLIDDSKEKVIC